MRLLHQTLTIVTIAAAVNTREVVVLQGVTQVKRAIHMHSDWEAGAASAPQLCPKTLSCSECDAHEYLPSLIDMPHEGMSQV